MTLDCPRTRILDAWSACILDVIIIDCHIRRTFTCKGEYFVKRRTRIARVNPTTRISRHKSAFRVSGGTGGSTTDGYTGMKISIWWNRAMCYKNSCKKGNRYLPITPLTLKAGLVFWYCDWMDYVQIVIPVLSALRVWLHVGQCLIFSLSWSF